MATTRTQNWMRCLTDAAAEDGLKRAKRALLVTIFCISRTYGLREASGASWTDVPPPDDGVSSASDRPSYGPRNGHMNQRNGQIALRTAISGHIFKVRTLLFRFGPGRTNNPRTPSPVSGWTDETLLVRELVVGGLVLATVRSPRPAHRSRLLRSRLFRCARAVNNLRDDTTPHAKETPQSSCCLSSFRPL